MAAKYKKFNMKAFSEDLTQWLIFTVTMPLVPIVIGMIMITLKNNQNPDFLRIASLKGEMLVASIAIYAEACSDMFKKSSSKSMKNLIGGLAIFFLIIGCTLGANI